MDLLVKGIDKHEEAGAALLYDRYEAEDLKTDGLVAEKDRAYHSIAAEASGRSYV